MTLRALTERLRETFDEGYSAYSKTKGIRKSTADFPKKLKVALKDKGFKGRSAYLDITDTVKIPPSTHAPQFDNFDYSYWRVLDLKSGQVTNPRAGQTVPSDAAMQTVTLTPDLIVFNGDEHSTSYMHVYMHPDTAKEAGLATNES